MNERYLFRGKRIDSGDFIIGYLWGNKNVYISDEAVDLVSVDPATVGQCTGLRDKNGILIFEGDIVTWVDSDDYLRTDIVEWLRGGLCLCNANYTVGSYLHRDLMVVGNIHGNSESLI